MKNQLSLTSECILNNSSTSLLEYLQRKIQTWVNTPQVAGTKKQLVNAAGSFYQPLSAIMPKEPNEPLRLSNKQLEQKKDLTAGLVVYNTTEKVCQRYNGNAWHTILHYPGERWMGGIVVDIDETGEHGLVTAISNQHTQVQWKETYSQSPLSAIEYKNPQTAPTDNWRVLRGMHTTYAIRMASRYCITSNGEMVRGWQIPTLDELLLILQENVAGKKIENGAAWGFQDQDTISWLYLPTRDKAIDLSPQQYLVRLVRSF